MSIITIATFLGIGLVYAILFAILVLKKNRIITLIFLLLITGFLYYKFKLAFYPNITLYSILPAVIIGILFGASKKQAPVKPFFDLPFMTNKGQKIIRDIYRGILVFGGAGSGKTDSVLNVIMNWLGENNIKTFAHDYKDGELTEMLIPIYGDKLKIFAIHRSEITARINILDKKYIQETTDIRAIMQTLIFGLTEFDPNKGGTNIYFYNGAVGIITGVVVIFKKRYPQYCTLPHVASFILNNDFSEDLITEQGIITMPFNKLVRFLKSDDEAMSQASDFIFSAGSVRTASSILSTLSGGLNKISFPKYSWALSENDVNLDINHPDNPYSIVVLNKPKDAAILSPVLTTIFQIATNQMSDRGRSNSCLLIDEAAQFKLKNMGTIVSTMRSFNIATVYCTQDLAQGLKNYSQEEFNEIIANLSTQFFGKANYPRQAKFYEEYFEPKNILSKSTSSKGESDIFASNKSTTLSEREVKKVRAHEFLRFQTGQFAFLSDGKSDVIRFPKPNIKRVKLPENDNIDMLILSNHNRIIQEAKTIGANI
ncbi:type IV secretory system conjugative DNA transfer family protein (plasmid) [Elizabethkingia anophelis]|uniref:type IV secretory system conjugative DNA transfer family protein n=1 Tax=Elizabethkingia anophelis TaxID=1117645 RepID=UPI0020B746B1|nr:type IV secretory system conjugative DNA transfer family protein [Elizabethkingia anophelis]UTG66816.1 type IV secretory system conjugative DNA transfer family protein [Elizabethkingia anophelis]